MNTPVRAAMNREFVTVDSHEMLEHALATMRAARNAGRRHGSP